MVDPARQVLLYLTYTDKLIDGSPKNSLTAVPLNGAKLQLLLLKHLQSVSDY